MLPKLNICEKKEKQPWKTCYTTKSSVLAHGKKTSSFFLKVLCQIYFVQKTKRTFLKTSCWKSKCWFVWFTKRKRKRRPLFTKLRLKWQNSAHFVQGKVCLLPKTKQRTLALRKKKQRFFFVLSFSELFFLPSFQNEGSKKQTNEAEVFFSFCQDNNVSCARQWNIFLFHNCPKSTSLWQLPLVETKKNSFFLLEKLRSYVCAKKVWTSEICNEK